MITVARLAVQSLQNRWLTALLSVLAIAVSVSLLLGVEKIRTGARASFANTISGTDLIVGARSGGIQLLLFSVFRIGNATNNMSWRSYNEIARHKDVSWIVPISLGDSHRGFRVVGTSASYFKHYRYRRDVGLMFRAGRAFDDLFDVVIGAEVAGKLGYKLGDELVLVHGLGEVLAASHDDMPFRVSGILAKTGTPVDRSVHVSLEAIEAIHVGWKGGARHSGRSIHANDVRAMTFTPSSVTAALVGLKSRIATFKVQRFVNSYRREALTAILPGVTLHELWGLLATAETALVVVSAMVVFTAILGMVTMILATLNERRREIAILRSVGAGPVTIIGLLASEATILTVAGVVVGALALYGGLFALRPVIESVYGLYIDIGPPGLFELAALAAIVGFGFLAGLVPAWRAYRQSVADGMMVKS